MRRGGRVWIMLCECLSRFGEFLGQNRARGIFRAKREKEDFLGEIFPCHDQKPNFPQKFQQKSKNSARCARDIHKNTI